MTLENAKRLYTHYVDKGMTAQAEDLLRKRPELKPMPAPKETTKKK